MWIGRPGDVREMRNPRRGAVKVPANELAQMVALSGAVHTSSRPKQPRRWSIELPWLPEAHADWLTELASKVHGPGPVVVVEPSTRNYLAPRQSVGRGRADHWSTSSGSISTQADGTNSWFRIGAGELRWVNPVWGRWPAAEGMVLSFATESGLTAGISWYDLAGTLLSGTSDPSGTVTATAPAGATWATPTISATVGGTMPVPRACLRYGDTVPASPWPVGEHVGAFAILNPQRLVERLPYGSVTLELLEQY
ncbi:hypothetical protein [Prauserella endophytica]|uniref:Uncharacterized protein n=1 Tax=Prauserella endophytica TaxID=1592324 RepID=A0ABY2S1M6_9PSEU|nr:hypothetical protein [Prauserella endophytica]PXY20308.1 hypothetical protein BAY59_31200 [Prauserella coralliicola]TKG66911.1 hypothetical protein FCN18_23645 [Prauserella endophytica]